MGFKTILITSIFILFPALCISSDFKVEIFEEHYNEKLIPSGGELKLYHTLQVKTIYGNKLLILVGKDYEYRQWLRNSFKKHYLYIIKIPDQADNKFEKDLAIPVNVQQIHPIWEKHWNCEGCRHDVIEEDS